jgi:HAD superfamily hydrolase (TIGR01458 family)
LTRPAAVLLDIDGHLTDGLGGPAIAGGPEAVQRLRARLPVRFLTNATSRSRIRLAEDLLRAGYEVDAAEIVTPTVLARRVLLERGDHRGLLLADAGVLEDLSWYEVTKDPAAARSVLLATEAHDRRIADLAPAVEALRAGARLYTLQQNRLFRRGARLLTDLGPVAAFLGYAADVGWENLGKPSPLVFEALAAELDLPLASLAMAGDDAEFDCAGALAAGVGTAVLVRTGKYVPGDERKVTPPPTCVIGSVAELPEVLEAV